MTYPGSDKQGIKINLSPLTEIGYLYLFGSIGMSKPMPASTAIPVIVSGTIVISLLFSYFVLQEATTWTHWLGCALMIVGISLLFIRDETLL